MHAATESDYQGDLKSKAELVLQGADRFQIVNHRNRYRHSPDRKSYPGNPEYFNGSILKQEITDSPGIVIERIKECVECYNSELWLNKQHHALVIEYQNLLKEGDRTSEFDLNAIQNILDKFERILDDRQERELQKILSYENIKDDFSKKEQENEKKLSDLNKKLEKCLEALGKSE